MPQTVSEQPIIKWVETNNIELLSDGDDMLLVMLLITIFCSVIT